jgi:pyridoxamine 5'-phosphate oxidase
MEMTKEEILEIIRSNPLFQLATVEGGQPRVRTLFLYRADQDGIVFHTGTMKDLCRQLLAEPRTELCFFDPKRGVQVRVTGKAESVDDLALKKEIVDHPARAFMKPWIDKMGFGILAVFRVRGGEATTWTMETNFAPKTPVRL